MPEKIVRIIKDWRHPELKRQSKDGNGSWNDYFFTEEPIKNYDYLVVLNRNKYDIHISNRDVPKFLISQEPPFHIWHKRSFRFFDQIFTQHHSHLFRNLFASHGALPWHVDKSYSELRAIKPSIVKKDKMVSCIASSTNTVGGHSKRLKFIEKIKSSNLQIDFFGRGVCEIPDKFEGLYPYKYSIAMENSSYPNYWTEKIADCFLSYTMPIYYGCKNISSYFPSDSYIWIDIDNPVAAIDKIKENIDNNTWRKNFDAIYEARELVLNKYQLFPFLSKIITDFKETTKPVHIIPANKAPWEKKYTIKEKIELKILSYV